MAGTLKDTEGTRKSEDMEGTGTFQVTEREGTRAAWDVKGYGRDIPSLGRTQRGQDVEGTRKGQGQPRP